MRALTSGLLTLSLSLLGMLTQRPFVSSTDDPLPLSFSAPLSEVEAATSMAVSEREGERATSASATSSPVVPPESLGAGDARGFLSSPPPPSSVSLSSSASSASPVASALASAEDAGTLLLLTTLADRVNGTAVRNQTGSANWPVLPSPQTQGGDSGVLQEGHGTDRPREGEEYLRGHHDVSPSVSVAETANTSASSFASAKPSPSSPPGAVLSDADTEPSVEASVSPTLLGPRSSDLSREMQRETAESSAAAASRSSPLPLLHTSASSSSVAEEKLSDVEAGGERQEGGLETDSSPSVDVLRRELQHRESKEGAVSEAEEKNEMKPQGGAWGAQPGQMVETTRGKEKAWQQEMEEETGKKQMGGEE
uniref:RxLR effector protein n=1 Tax=Chromera velia CCMP2878 TaxID=1169474 RepID=A0A0G4FAZ4_9ALVE|eukprot:Cvel_3017.t1-p1 / transcript=Cvel_3017.t1 / gene=Cvel_3017 / organism=Chromera_velia_CCMP2878 / gene_product=hypothetical protein / transcript_product=hypothetical protein / location=Cvel_scaffold120:58800-60796(-) / protein_length=366 / sequence_SO=supercontig / SO=protein_coding / is_pseudo=false